VGLLPLLNNLNCTVAVDYVNNLCDFFCMRVHCMGPFLCGDLNRCTGVRPDTEAMSGIAPTMLIIWTD